MEEHFAARNCYWGNEHSNALSSNTKARSLPSSKIAKVGVNRISRCAAPRYYQNWSRSSSVWIA